MKSALQNVRVLCHKAKAFILILACVWARQRRLGVAVIGPTRLIEGLNFSMFRLDLFQLVAQPLLLEAETNRQTRINGVCGGEGNRKQETQASGPTTPTRRLTAYLTRPHTHAPTQSPISPVIST